MVDQKRESNAKRFRLFVGVTAVLGAGLVGVAIVAANRSSTGEGATQAAVYAVIGGVLLVVALIAAIAWSLRPKDR